MPAAAISERCYYLARQAGCLTPLLTVTLCAFTMVKLPLGILLFNLDGRVTALTYIQSVVYCDNNEYNRTVAFFSHVRSHS